MGVRAHAGLERKADDLHGLLRAGRQFPDHEEQRVLVHAFDAVHREGLIAIGFRERVAAVDVWNGRGGDPKVHLGFGHDVGTGFEEAEEEAELDENQDQGEDDANQGDGETGLVVDQVFPGDGDHLWLPDCLKFFL